MSKYTTEVRFICESAIGLNESKGYDSVNDIIRKALPVVFNFDFPIFDETYRSVLETKILKRFYLREIAHETVGIWKLRLETKLNEIMPYYNKLYNTELLNYNPLYTTNLSKTHEGKGTEDTIKTENDVENNIENTQKDITKRVNITNEGTSNNTTNNNETNTTQGNSLSTGNKNSMDAYSDTPQGTLSNLENNTYLTNARKISDTDSNNISVNNTDTKTGTLTASIINTNEEEEVSSVGDTTNKSNNRSNNRNGNYNVNSTESYLETIVGYEGKDASELIIKFRESFINIDVMILNELEDLFFQLW